jgi:hypothetical protein
MIIPGAQAPFFNAKLKSNQFKSKNKNKRISPALSSTFARETRPQKKYKSLA